MCEKAGKQVRFCPAEALKFDSVKLFYFPTPRIIQENHDQSKSSSQPKISLLILLRGAYARPYALTLTDPTYVKDHALNSLTAGIDVMDAIVFLELLKSIQSLFLLLIIHKAWVAAKLSASE